MRTHLVKAWQVTGERPPELQTPEPPASLAYLMAWFTDLATGRAPGFEVPACLSWGDILAWQHVMHHHLQPWEVAVIRHLDALWLIHWRKGRPKQTSPRKPGR